MYAIVIRNHRVKIYIKKLILGYEVTLCPICHARLLSTLNHIVISYIIFRIFKLLGALYVLYMAVYIIILLWIGGWY